MCCFASSYGKIEALPGGKKESHYKIDHCPFIFDGRTFWHRALYTDDKDARARRDSNTLSG